MPRYFFDVRDGESFDPDLEGMALPDLQSAEREAIEALKDYALDGFSAEAERRIAIEVRDNGAQPVLRAALSYGVERLTRS
jgi:hypothetical protein